MQQPLLFHMIKKLRNGWLSESDERRDWLTRHLSSIPLPSSLHAQLVAV